MLVWYQYTKNDLKKVSDGKIQVVKDEETKSHVVEIIGQNCSTNFIEGPNAHKDGFGLKLPYLHVLVKNVSLIKQKKVTDSKKQRRRFKFSNWFKDTRVKSTVVNIKLKMGEGWNHFAFDLYKITQKSYGTTLQEVNRMVVNANCRLRRIYFCDKIYKVSQIPNDFKLFIQGQNNGKYQEQVEDEEEEQEEEQDN